MLKTPLIVTTILFTAIGSWLLTTAMQWNTEERIEKSISLNREGCLYGAERAREAFINTEFSDWNFYETCLLNVMCSNPEKECPREAIAQESERFIYDK